MYTDGRPREMRGRIEWEAMMRTMAMWLGAVLMVGGVWSASVIRQGPADEPRFPAEPRSDSLAASQ
jgi:hypothetical protein